MTKKQDKSSEYTAKDIQVLEGLEPVRKRPAMYIGSTGTDGLHHLIFEVLDNAVDEAIGGYAKNIEVTLLPSNRVQVIDDGRGIPVEKHPQTKKSTLETVLTILHAGGKFGGKAYKKSGGLHGVGVSVVNALSIFLRADVCREGMHFQQEYSRGKAKSSVKKVGKCKGSGTSIIFEPDPEIFKDIHYDTKRILSHLRQQAYLTPGTKIVLVDAREKEKQAYSFYFEGGLASYVSYLTRGRTPKHENVFFAQSEKEGIIVESAFQYTQEFETMEESFANNIYTVEGGTHLTGFRSALTRTLNEYAKKNNFLKGEEALSGDDVREGLTAVVSVKIREPQFEGQTKAKLGNPEAKAVVEAAVGEALEDYLERNPQDARLITEKCIIASKARQAARAARQTVLRKGVLEGLALPGKLADCSSKDPKESELYIVEGVSAGGCFSGDTRIALTDGRDLTFTELVQEYKEGKHNYCYTVQDDGRIGIEKIFFPRRTKQAVEVCKIILDNDQEIVCTSDHKFLLRDGSYKPAHALRPTDSLMPFSRQISHVGKRITIEGYEMLYQPMENRWVFTHMLADEYNLRTRKYRKADGVHRHHLDFNKQNNNPDNVVRLSEEVHLEYHRQHAEKTLRRPDVIKKMLASKETLEYRAKIKKTMSSPKMRKMLRERARQQWSNKEYKNYMKRKFSEFYAQNEDYRTQNKVTLYQARQLYWGSLKNRKKQAERMRNYFQQHPEKRYEYSTKAVVQWQNPRLRAWRRQKTIEQWTPEFRSKRKIAYNTTYKRKALVLMRELIDRLGQLKKEMYEQERLRRNDKSVLRYDTICNRFFCGNEQKLQEAVERYNHKVLRVEKLTERVDVYDLEVPRTHNFALASGVFVHNSAKEARDRRFQAILPLRGKILNVERARLDKILSSKEIRSLVIALGTAIAEDFDIEKTRYHRIIILSDADVDGSHIRTLHLTLFYRYFRPLIERGYLYIAQPPLYKIQTGKTVQYVFTEQEKDKVVASLKKEEKKAVPNIQRYKGLGEMNPGELWETTMDPAKRTLLQVTVENAREADKIFDVLMGDEVAPRKKFIQTYAKSVKNLDI